MEDFTTINERTDVVRDNNSKALLNTNINAKKAWISKKEKNKKIFENEIEINIIKKELGNIKIMISKLTNVLTNILEENK